MTMDESSRTASTRTSPTGLRQQLLAFGERLGGSRLENRAETAALRDQTEQLQRQIDALSDLRDAVHALAAELEAEGERLRGRPGMWGTATVAMLCDHTAAKLHSMLDTGAASDASAQVGETGGGAAEGS